MIYIIFQKNYTFLIKFLKTTFTFMKKNKYFYLDDKFKKKFD